MTMTPVQRTLSMNLDVDRMLIDRVARTPGVDNVRIVVITADRYNPLHGLVAPLRERAAPDPAPAFLLPLGRPDWPTPAD